MKLKVLNVACVRWWSALAHYAHTVAVALQKRGHQVVAAGSRGSPYLQHCRDSGIAVDDGIDPTQRGLFRWMGTFRRIREILQTGQANVVIVHSGNGHGELALARQGVGAKHVLVRARPEIRPPRPYPWNLWVHGRATDRFLLSGEFMKEQHYRRWPVSPGRMTVLHGAIDVDHFSRDRWGRAARDVRDGLGIPAEATVIGILGRLSPVKGHRVALEGLLPLLAVHSNLHLLIVGREAQIRWAELAQGIPLENQPRVHYVGHVDEIAGHAAACNIGVIPSIGSEAVCRVAMEWMSLGIPVVGTSVNVIPEIIQSGRTGWIVPPRDPRALRRTVEEILQDPAEAERRALQGHDHARREFSFETVGRRLEELLSGALRGEPWGT
jgi:glycosyltransferase involved in cell wall biosynthesis